MSDLDRARKESYRTVWLDELDGLLNKHPDVARILDLIEMTR